MEKEFRNLQMEIPIKELMKMVNLTDMVNIFGMMGAHTKDNLRMDLEMVKEYGENLMMPIQIHMKDNLLMRKNRDMVFLFGQMEVNTWVIL
jgi:hypothetical protein